MFEASEVMMWARGGGGLCGWGNFRASTWTDVWPADASWALFCHVSGEADVGNFGQRGLF